MKMLNICKLFFEHLNSNHIRYCHWKSNSHLDKALNGETDLDILIHPDDKKKFEHSCSKFKIKEILSPPDKQFPGLADYLGFDYETGHLIHLHVHYRLVLGQRYIKNHHLPIEDVFFSHLTTKYNIPIPIPELELIVLIIRAHMKLDLISLLKHGIRNCQGQYYCPFPCEIEEEMVSLISASNMKTFNIVLAKCHLPLPSALFEEFIKKFSKNKLNSLNIFKTARTILVSLKSYRRSKKLSIHLQYLWHIFHNSRVGALLVKPKKKTVIGRGKIFSLVGADGSGKSTLIADLEKWLSWKLSIRRYYYGIPKTRTIAFAELTIQVANKLKLRNIAGLTANCLWLFIARTRYSIFLQSQSATLRNMTVLTDRFPVKDFYTMESPMDGPRLSRRASRVEEFFSQIEISYYLKITPPDILFALQVDIEELRKRKRDLPKDVHIQKSSAVNAIRKNKKTILINANHSYKSVFLELKRNIWELL